MIDIAILVLVVLYAGLGYWTGLIRRVIGFIAVYAGYIGATNASPAAANVILQALPNWAIPDATTAGFFLVVVIVVVVAEVLATFIHGRLQLAALVYDRPSGAILGAITAILGVTVAIHLILVGAQPLEGSPDGAQIQEQDAIRHSALAQLLLNTAGRPAVAIFGPVIPASPDTYFNGQGPRAQ